MDIPEYMYESLRKANQETAEQDKPREFKDGVRPIDHDDFRYMDDVTICQAFGSRKIVLYLVVMLIYW